MIAILRKTLLNIFLIALVGCGVRGPLYLPNIPPAPIPPSTPEPKGALYPASNKDSSNVPANSK
jgi:predicted small lipoprotein YifL